jgi:nitroreductase
MEKVTDMQCEPGAGSALATNTTVSFRKSPKLWLRQSPWFLKYHAVRRSIRNGRKAALLVVVRAASISGFTSSLYYALLSREFDREHRSVLLGKLAFQKNLKNYNGTHGLFRRNIHRLEKGLIMKNRRSIFALDYIQDTIDLYEGALNHAARTGIGSNEVHWAHEVLSNYFAACAASPLSATARARFEALPPPPNAAEHENYPVTHRTPYPAAERTAASVSYEQLHELALRRRSVRWFHDRPVEREKLDKMIDLARLSPSACNRLPYRFEVFTQPGKAQEGARLAGGTGGFSHQIPALIVVMGDLSCYSEEKDRHLIYIDASLASMALMLSAETLGLSTCPINWSDVSKREKGMYKFLGNTPEHWRPIMLIAVGYAEDDGSIPYSSKKNMTLIRSFDGECI